jgi:hypothetical protein
MPTLLPRFTLDQPFFWNPFLCVGEPYLQYFSTSRILTEFFSNRALVPPSLPLRLESYLLVTH